MLAQERWGEARFLPMVMLAQTAANGAEDAFEILKLAQMRSLSVLESESTVSRKAWTRLYRRPVSLEATIVGLVAKPDTEPQEARRIEYRHAKREGHNLLKEWLAKGLSGKVTERDEKLITRVWQRSYRKHLREIQQIAHGDEASLPAAVPAWFGSAEVMFFLSVVVPCMGHYQTTPWKLYRKALAGDFLSLEKLVRLDRRILSEERIADRLDQMERRNGKGAQLLYEATKIGVAKPLKLIGVKYLIGGWLLHIADEMQHWLDGEGLFEIILQKTTQEKLPEVLKWIEERRAEVSRNRIRCRLTATAIADLFHAVYQDSGRGRFDPDFRKLDKTVYRRLDRNAALYPSLRKGNKTRVA